MKTLMKSTKILSVIATKKVTNGQKKIPGTL